MSVENEGAATVETPSQDQKGGDAAPESKAGQVDQKAADSKPAAGSEATIQLTAEEFKAWQDDRNANQARLDKLENTLKSTLSSKEKDRLKAISDKEAADKRAADAEREKNEDSAKLQDQIVEIQKQLTTAKRVASEKECSAAVSAALRGVTFVGADAATQKKAADTFSRLAREAIEARENEDGTFTVQSKGGGKSAGEVLSAMLDEHAYLVARKGQPGIPLGGGQVPGDTKMDATQEYMARRAAARRSVNGVGDEGNRDASIGLWAPSKTG